MKRSKIAFGVLALGLGALGSGFTGRPAITAGWYGASDGAVAKSSSPMPPAYSQSNFATLIGTAEPTVGPSGDCQAHTNFVCAAYFTTGGTNTNDPNGLHHFFVTGDFNN